MLMISTLVIGQVDFDPTKLKRNTQFNKNTISHKDISITIPIDWQLWSKNETEYLKSELNKQSEYRMEFDYYLTLNSQEDYPNITVAIKESEDFRNIPFNDFKNYFKELYGQMTETVLDGMDSFITNHNDESFLVDEENNRFFVKSTGTVANIGSVRSNSVIIMIEQYVININYSNTLEQYDKFESALLIMANSIKIKK